MASTKLIILRGPSGSGKSTVAKELRKCLKDTAALIEQDYLRRVVLKEKDKPEAINPQLIFQTVQFALDHGYHVILEGIFKKQHYARMFEELWRIHPQENYVYYFDIPFEETLERHQTKSNASEWGELEMRNWWLEHDTLDVPSERPVLKDWSVNYIAQKILRDSRLISC